MFCPPQLLIHSFLTQQMRPHKFQQDGLSRVLVPARLLSGDHGASVRQAICVVGAAPAGSAERVSSLNLTFAVRAGFPGFQQMAFPDWMEFVVNRLFTGR
ncbi:hypothetical protein VTK26DRAFT_8584 [Humicola hyalothermophila]